MHPEKFLWETDAHKGYPIGVNVRLEWGPGRPLPVSFPEPRSGNDTGSGCPGSTTDLPSAYGNAYGGYPTITSDSCIVG